MTKKRLTLGRKGEELARGFLEKKGVVILEQNFRTRSGEIDLIGREGKTLVFVEVKTRSSRQYGHPLEAVTARKRAQLTRVALEYLSRNALYDQPARFDVVSVLAEEGKPEVEVVRNAFEVNC